MARAFRFGVNMLAVGDRAEWIARCRRAEELGYDVVLVPDHLGMPAPLPSLMMAAEATETVRLGTFVLNAGFYNPVVLARDVAAVNNYTGGRLELGLGAGYVRAEFEEAGLPWPTPGERVSHLERTVEKLSELAVPLVIGGNGDRVLRLAATKADVVAFAGLKASPADGQLSVLGAVEIDERVSFVRAAAGDRDYESNILVQTVVPTTDRRAAADALREKYRVSFTVGEMLEWPGFLAGQPQEIAEQLRVNRDRFGFSYITVLDPALEDFAPVIELLKE
jgi:probable F420-dependent oxidoreductase